jgi:intracellular sulfur oxidation DsrE/DsrF family protein
MILVLVALFCSVIEFGQNTNVSKYFNGATTNLKSYKAIYYLNDSSHKLIKGTLRNIKNAMGLRLKGNLEVKLVVFGDGVEVFKKTSNYVTLLTALQSKGVLLVQCLNTLKKERLM